MNFETISAKDLDAYIGRKDCLIIDTRDPGEFAKGHILGAYNLPYEQIEEGVALRTDLLYVLYCERGSSSLAAAKELTKSGCQVKTVIGGLNAYRGKYLTKAYKN